MDSSSFSSLAAVSAQAAPPGVAWSRSGKAAREFEAELIGSLLANLEKTFATVPGENNLPGEDNYNYLSTEALASALAASGGFGIARLIARHLDARK